jgi:MFS transporter, SP family, sugar:H+ symporter
LGRVSFIQSRFTSRTLTIHSFCFICIFFVWGMIYETKGLSLEQVDELYAKVGKAWQSKSFVPTVSFQDVAQVSQGDAARKQSLTDLENIAERKKSVGHDEHMADEKIV